jgi:NAD(P)H-hydrate epimerase
MIEIPKWLYSAEQGRELDRRAAGIPGYEEGRLMQMAGIASFRSLQGLWPGIRSLAVCCGPGNNGGDGYVVAGLAARHGLQVYLMGFGEPKTLDSERAYRYALASGVSVMSFHPDVLLGAEVVVDAILGTGLKHPLGGQILEGIRAINASGKPVLSLDVPTGLDSDTGEVAKDAVGATATISFICLNPGIVTGNGPDRCGRILFDSLQVPETIFSGMKPVATRISTGQVAGILEKLPYRQHKGDAGHLLVVGGALGMGGAVCLASEAALRVGAGLVSVATRPEHASHLNTRCPELMVKGIESGANLSALLQRATAVVVGPGLGLGSWGRELLSKVLEIELPLVVDADGLNILSAQPTMAANWILTPHPGEAARLLDGSTHEVQKDRLGAVQRIQEGYGGVCILKGAGTLVATPNGSLSVCNRGNPGMASAGMGDVLAGVIGSLLAQGLDLGEAAKCGAWLHSAAADLAATGGERGMIARDLFPELRRLADNPATPNE